MEQLFDNPANLTLLVISEILFAAHVAMGIWVGFLRRQRRQLQRISQEQQDTIQKLSQQLQHRKDVSDDATKALKGGSLVNEQRIKNLERFRKLYFELDARLNSELVNAKAMDEQINELNRTLNNQNHVIRTLKNSIHEISEKYTLEHDSRTLLENNIKELENCSDKLRNELDSANKKLTRTSIMEKELDHFRERVDHLEISERHLQQETQHYKAELEDLHKRLDNPHPHGVVKITEIEQLSSKLSKKEKEISRLKNECDTIAKQYEELASSSLRKLEEMSRATKEEQINVQQLQFILDQSAKALAEKNKKVEELEQRLMQHGLNATEETRSAYQKQLQEKKELEVTFFEAADKATHLLEGEDQEQLKNLKASFNKKRESLRTQREDLLDIHDQKANNSSLSSETALREENQLLKKKIQHLKQQTAILARKDEEILRLNQDLENLEQKYLELIDTQAG